MTYKLPEGWKKVKLGEAVIVNPRESLERGKMFRKIAMADVLGYVRKVSSYTFDEYKGGSRFRNGDTLFSRITPCLENGKIAYVNILEKDEVAFGSTEFLILRNIDGVSEKKYIYYLSLSPIVRDKSIKSMVGSSGRQRVQTDVLKDISISLPPLPEQKAIADTLSVLDDKIEVNRQINANLEAQAQAIFKHWFIDFEFPDENGKLYKSSGGEMVKSDLGMIPRGWEVGKLEGMAIRENKNIKFPNDKTYYHFSIPAFDNYGTAILEHGMDIKSNKYKISNENVLLSRLNPRFKRLWRPICEGDNCVCSTEFIVLKAKNKDYKNFIYSVMDSKRFNDFTLENVTGATNSHQRISPPSIILEYKLPLPKNELLDTFVVIIDGIYKKIDNNIIQNQKLAQLRDTLLPKLMSGQIRIPLD